MYEKMDALLSLPHDTPRVEVARDMNRWDSQYVDYQTCAENNCNTFKDGTVGSNARIFTSSSNPYSVIGVLAVEPTRSISFAPVITTA
jgi:hypothetical protein